MSNSANNVLEKLKQIRNSEKETYLFPLLKLLFQKKGFSNVEITHGSNEFGKDLVYSRYDEDLQEEVWTSVIVKNKSSSQADFELGGEIARQVHLSFNHPHITSSAKEKSINNVIVIANGSVGQQSKKILAQAYNLPHYNSNTYIWNQDRIAEEFDKYIKDAFLDQHTPVTNIFKEKQLERISKVTLSSLLSELNIEGINDIFVNVTTTHRKQLEKSKAYSVYADEKGKSPKKKIEIDEALEFINERKNFIIHGIATSGKSLLLKRIGYYTLNSNKPKPDALFYFELNKYKNNIKEFDLPKLIAQQFSELTIGADFEREKFDYLRILIDGLDEIKLKEDKIEILRKIKEFELQITGSKYQIIITSRTTDVIDQSELLLDYERTELLPFDISQALLLVKKIIPNNNSKSNAFIGALKNTLLTNGFARTPMALTLMAILYRDDEIDLNELPANVTELYNKFTDYYLNRWDSSKGVTLQYKYEETKQILALVAFELHKNGFVEIDEENLKALLNKLSSKYDYEDLKDIPRFIRSLKDEIGLIEYNKVNGSFRFYNQSFQEFFNSIAIDDDSEKKLLENYLNEWWENSIIFYSGKQPKRESFIKNVLKTIIPTEIVQKYQYLNVLSKSLQANHLISRELKLEISKRLLFEFNSFYTGLLTIGAKELKGYAVSRNTIDLIIDFRDFFSRIFSSKHINNEDFQKHCKDILSQHYEHFDETTLYSITHFLAFKCGYIKAYEDFMKIPNLNVRWSRITFIDLQYLDIKNKFDTKTFNRIKQKQRKNKDYIQEQFRGNSVQHLVPGSQFIE